MSDIPSPASLASRLLSCSVFWYVAVAAFAVLVLWPWFTSGLRALLALSGAGVGVVA